MRLISSPSEDQLSNLLKALGHPTRVEIIRQLSNRDRCCTGDFCDCMSLAQSTISQHLELLVSSGLVEKKLNGTRSLYTLNRDKLSKLAKAIEQIAETDCCADTEAKCLKENNNVK